MISKFQIRKHQKGRFAMKTFTDIHIK